MVMRLIDIDDVNRKLFGRSECTECTDIDCCSCFREWLEEVPTIDAEPVIHAHWIEDGYFGFPNVCSHCGSEWKKKTKRCPNCGAIMDEKVRLNG